jgi:hypothetical protein
MNWGRKDGKMIGRTTRRLLLVRAAMVLAGVCCLALVTGVAARAAAPPTLNPAPDQGSTRKTVGGGTICRFSHVEAVGPKEDPNIVCGSGANAFHIFDQWVDNESRTWWYDENGNLTYRTDHDVYSFGQWSNLVTGDVVPYTEHSVETDVPAVPGDETSEIVTFTGENIYRTPTGKFVLQAVGRQVFNFDGDLLSSHGPNAFVAAFYENDPHAFDQICAALGAT